MKVIAIILLLGVAGCAQSGELSVQAEPNKVFQPSAQLVTDVVWELAEATGLDLQFAEDGVPIAFPDRVFHEGVEVCGKTYTHITPSFDITSQEVFIATAPHLERCGSLRHTLQHELIHVMNPFVDHVERGLFSTTDKHVEGFDTASLEVVCAEQPCQWVRAESL